MKRRTKILVAFLVAASLVSAVTALADTIYFPQVIKNPTITPTPQPTATRTPTRTPSRTTTPTRTPTPKPGVYILQIYPDPPIIFPFDELNEYIEFENTSSSSVDMDGWYFKVEKVPGLAGRYNFPDNFVLRGDRTVRVWTGPGDNTSTDLYWGKITPMWNDNSDCAYLNDDDGDLVDKYCYPEDT